MSIDWMEVLTRVAPAVAVYVAIRVDIAELKVKTQRAQDDIQVLFKMKERP